MALGSKFFHIPYDTHWIGWNKWEVIYEPSKMKRGRVVATFIGKFAGYRAERRVGLLMKRYRRDHVPSKLPLFQTVIHKAG
jgi:hypothetical protein